MHDMPRTSIILDAETRKAARELALRYDCSTSEAIRRAVLRHRDAVMGTPAALRRKRGQVLERLFDLFSGHDAAEEIKRLKTQDAGF